MAISVPPADTSPLPSHSTLYRQKTSMLQISSSRSPPPHVVTTWGGSASRESEGGGREGGSRGKWIDGRTKRVHVYMHVLGEEKKWLPVFLLLVPPPTHTCRYMYMYMVYLFLLFPHPPLYHLILPCTLPISSFSLFFPPSSIPPSTKCVYKKS